LQRLFSTFPEGWPGTGLLFLRAAAAIPAIQHAVIGRLTTNLPALEPLYFAAAMAAALLLAGLWTPVVGVLMALAEVSLALSHPADPGMHVVLAALAAALAMLGPGAWSVDARRFGRKRIQIPSR
jgi:putative oxidoreductase